MRVECPFIVEKGRDRVHMYVFTHMYYICTYVVE